MLLLHHSHTFRAHKQVTRMQSHRSDSQFLQVGGTVAVDRHGPHAGHGKDLVLIQVGTKFIYIYIKYVNKYTLI